MLFAMASRRRACWLLAASFSVAAGTLASFTHDERSTVAQPGGDPCMSAIGDIFGIPGLGDLGDNENVSVGNVNVGNVNIGGGGNVQQTNIDGSRINAGGNHVHCCNVNIGNVGGGNVVQTNIGGNGDCTP
jgi:hypothetical protein